MDLNAARSAMRGAGVLRLFAKVLAANDNSKNQPYFGGDFSVLNILPAGTPEAATTGTYAKPIFKAPLNFSWLSDDGVLHPAPNAKLILYPQYPEVRFSGYLQGCRGGPTQLMGSTRVPGRVLLLGVTADGRIIGHASPPGSAIARAIAELRHSERVGVFARVPLAGHDSADDRVALLNELRRIAEMAWIPSRRLDSAGVSQPCNAPNCGGYTLEAELGIIPNGISEPDYRGWEVKQHAVGDFSRYSAGAITLMTPEPTAGVYAEKGVHEFVDRYGYQDTKGRLERRNFGGTHRFGMVCERSGLELTLTGYDGRKRQITDANGGVVLVDRSGESAAVWPYTSILQHWKRKHAFAAYVPSLTRDDPVREYRYGHRVRLGTGTDILKFLHGVASGVVYYDPGIKVEGTGAKRRSKRRSQFRIRSADLGSLYGTLETVDLTESD